MLSATLRSGLSDYGIGGKIRTLRLKKKMGLVELGKHTGLSPALLCIALVFGVGLEFFFAGAREKPLVAVVRQRERVRLPERPQAGNSAFHFESLDYPAVERRFNAYYAEFLPVARDKRRAHDHGGAEFIYVLKGTLSVQIGTDEHALGQGDSIYFDSSIPHSYSRSGQRACSAIVVTTV
jgi:quercetin dioxygenase-like cupin family protein